MERPKSLGISPLFDGESVFEKLICTTVLQGTAFLQALPMNELKPRRLA
jgi:hypothetical protein